MLVDMVAHPAKIASRGYDLNDHLHFNWEDGSLRLAETAKAWNVHTTAGLAAGVSPKHRCEYDERIERTA